MKFKPEEQILIDAMVADAYTRAFKKAGGQGQKTAELEKRTSALEEQLKQAREGARDSELRSAATLHGACHPPDVAYLLKDNVKIDENGAMTVVDPASQKQRFDKAGSPLTIDGLMGDWIGKNPHFAKAKAAASPGSGGGLFFGLFK